MKHLLKLFLFSLIFSQFNLNAQVTLNFNSINEFIFNSREALNFTVINSNPKSFQIKIKGKITDGNGQSIAEFVSTPVMLQTGANVFGRMNIDFQEINYFNADIAEIELKTGTYPSGQYRICIWSTCVTADCDGAGEYAGSIENPVCVQVNVENPTPLLLSYPGDNSEIEETRPVYTWIPPAPVSGIGGLNYKMVLVEMMEGQSKSDALAMNRALIEAEGLPNSVFSHPADIDALEEGKWYAWQVQAYVGSTYIASSEQWKFKVKKEEKQVIPKQAIFPKELKDPYVYQLNSDTLLLGITKTISSEGKILDELKLRFKSPQGQILSEINVSTNSNAGYLLLKLSKSELEKISKNNFIIIEVVGIEGNSRFLKIQL